MAENSQIQWTTHTQNFWHGCIKISPGCKFCYMYRDKERYGQDPQVITRSKTTFNNPLKWHKKLTGSEPLTERLVFTNSWSDFFLAEADPQWRTDAWKIIRNTPNLVYQILTKRPENISEMLPDDWGDGYPNVWLGVSAENQQWWNERVDALRWIPAAVKFVSAEPLLDTIHSDMQGIDWVIVGGESGNDNGYYKYRPSDLDWYQSIVKECQVAGVPVFVKQLGTYLAKQLYLKDHHGGDMGEWPKELQIREFPK